MNKIKGVIFDFNGTLFWDGEKHEQAWSMMAEKLRGYPFSKEDLANHMHGQINTAIVSYLLNKPLCDEEARPYSLEKEAIYRSLCLEDPGFLSLAPGAVELFQWLQDHHIPQSIATASIKENVDFFIETFQLHKWFPKQCITFDDGINKDKTDMFLKAAQAMNVPIEECLIIEDSFSGIAFAKAVHAGMIIAITPRCNLSSYENLPAINQIIHDFHNFDTSIFMEENKC